METWTKSLELAVKNADRIIHENDLMLVSAPRARQLSELAGGDLTREEATAWDYLMGRE